MRVREIITSVTMLLLMAAICVIIGSSGVGPTLIQDNYAYVIVIDAGHGGIDSGVVGVSKKVKESEINLKIAFVLKDLFEENGFSVVMTRTTNDGLYGNTQKGFKRRDMEARKKIILSANADLVVSVHQNAYKQSYRRGAQVFYQKGSESGERFAKAMQQVFNQRSKRNNEYLPGDFYICRCSNVPTVIAECGFLSNPQDEAKLLTEEYRKEVAVCIMKGCVSFLFGINDAYAENN